MLQLRNAVDTASDNHQLAIFFDQVVILVFAVGGEELAAGRAELLAAEPQEMQIPLAHVVLWKRPKAR